MRRTGLLWVAVAAIAIIIGGCSKTEGTKPPSSEQPAGRSGGVGTGGAGANLRATATSCGTSHSRTWRR